METFILGFMLYVFLPLDVWAGLDEAQQQWFTEYVCSSYLHEKHCHKAKLIITQTNNQVQFFFHCEELEI
jgi:hypothetical protein